MELKGIITKLEFKALLYLKGLEKSQIIDVVRMENYISYSYKNSQGYITTSSVEIEELYECSKHHTRALLLT